MKKVHRKPDLLSGIAMLAGAFFAQTSIAQTGFDNGSFGEGSFQEQQPTPTQPTPTQPAPSVGGDSFGGSFGDGGGVQPAPTPTPAPPGQQEQVPEVGGSNFDDGGSFGGGGGGITPAPAPPPPTPQPQPPQPPVMQVDPQILAFESRDFGVQPSQQLRQGQFHSPTPTSIPGGQVVSTAELASAMNNGTQMVLIDVLGSDYSLPNAFMAPAMASAGQFNDRVQQQTVQWLGQITGGQSNTPVVIYCSDPNCWLSYNAALRAINAGYGSVYWYRGGMQAWQMAGLPMYPASY